jgi:hypothetical protein
MPHKKLPFTGRAEFRQSAIVPKECQPKTQAFVVQTSSTIQAENVLLTFHLAAVPLLDVGKFLGVPC